MFKYLISMGGSEQGKNRWNDEGIHRNYTAEVLNLFESSKPYGYICKMYDNDWLRNSIYYKQYHDVLDEPSFGWAFKPICIWETILNTNEGDLIFWVDSNHYFKSDPKRIEDCASNHNIFCHEHDRVVYPNMDWTHKDMFVNMGCDEFKFWNARQMQVNVMMFLNSDFTRQFVKEWVSYSCRYDVMIQNKLPNFPSFRAHRHEQSIFSILVEKYQIRYNPDPLDIIGETRGVNIE